MRINRVINVVIFVSGRRGSFPALRDAQTEISPAWVIHFLDGTCAVIAVGGPEFRVSREFVFFIWRNGNPLFHYYALLKGA